MLEVPGTRSINRRFGGIALAPPLAPPAGLRRLDEVLVRAGLSARFTGGTQSYVLARSTVTAGPVVEFRFANEEAFDRCLNDLRLYSFANAYFNEQLNIIGPIAEAMNVLYAINVANDRGQSIAEWIGGVAFRILKATVPSIAMRFESDAHYSMSAEAYALFLDPFMQYTCAKFISGSESIEQAQLNKFKLIADISRTHLGTLVGRSHLDIGCGWGGLIGYFTNTVGMRSLGLTNNASQAAYATKHFGAHIVLSDFSELRDDMSFDLVTIVGMAEHLTPRRRSQLFQRIRKCLSDEGLVYFQCIARPGVWIGGDAYRLAYREVFPGHYLETRAEMEARFTKLGFDVLYVSDDALDYARTTAAWVKNLEQNRIKIVGFVGERNYRIFLGYLAYASTLFSAGRGSLMRYVLRPRKGVAGHQR